MWPGGREDLTPPNPKAIREKLNKLDALKTENFFMGNKF